MAPPRKLRAKRARARQRERQGHDLRPHYYQADLPPAPDLAIVEFDDPYALPGWINPEGTLDPTARLKQARRADGSVAEGEPEWVAPPRPRIQAIGRLKEDPLGRMRARHQVDESQYLGGREYQRLYDSTQVALVRSVDWSKTRVSGGQRPDPLTEERQRASRKLHHANDAVMHRHGAEGLTLVRDVLCERRSVELAGRMRGAKSSRDTRWFGTLFRKCLSVLAVQFGFSSSTRASVQRIHPFNDGPNPTDPDLHADAVDLADARLRSGWPNGQAK